MAVVTFRSYRHKNGIRDRLSDIDQSRLAGVMIALFFHCIRLIYPIVSLPTANICSNAMYGSSPPGLCILLHGFSVLSPDIFLMADWVTIVLKKEEVEGES